MVERVLSKTKSSSLDTFAIPIRMRSTERGLLFPLDEVTKEVPESKDKARKCATRVSQVMNDFSATIASQLSKTKESELTTQEMTEILMKDPELWKEFLKELDDSKIVTNFGIDIVLKNFIAKKRKIIKDRHEDFTKLASSDDSHGIKNPIKRVKTWTGILATASSEGTEDRQRESVTGMIFAAPSVGRTFQRKSSVFHPTSHSAASSEGTEARRKASVTGIVSAASSVGRAFQRAASGTLQSAHLSSDILQDMTDKQHQRLSEPLRRNASFDADYWDSVKSRRMSQDVDTYKRNILRFSQDSLVDAQTKNIIDNSPSSNAEWDLESSTTTQNSRYGLLTRMASFRDLKTALGSNVKSNLKVDDARVDLDEGNYKFSLPILPPKHAGNAPKMGWLGRVFPPRNSSTNVVTRSEKKNIETSSNLCNNKVRSMMKLREERRNNRVGAENGFSKEYSGSSVHRVVSLPLMSGKAFEEAFDSAPFATTEQSNHDSQFYLSGHCRSFCDTYHDNDAKGDLNVSKSCKPSNFGIKNTANGVIIDEASLPVNLEMKNAEAPAELHTVYMG